MARQQDACWRCGTDWATEEQPRTPLRVISGGAVAPTGETTWTAVAAVARWSDEGGHP